MKRVVFSYHALRRMLERGFNEDTVRFVIEHADVRVFGSKNIAMKKMDGKVVRVVYVEKERYINVVTVYSFEGEL